MRPAPKQISLVLQALSDGADHSREIADMTGMRVPYVSSYLNELEKAGIIRRTGRIRRAEEGRSKRTPPSIVWELV
jgi:DNA-binding MarR family transcriptional regulator